jgi:hypothetical protein
MDLLGPLPAGPAVWSAATTDSRGSTAWKL